MAVSSRGLKLDDKASLIHLDWWDGLKRLGQRWRWAATLYSTGRHDCILYSSQYYTEKILWTRHLKQMYRGCEVRNKLNHEEKQMVWNLFGYNNFDSRVYLPGRSTSDSKMKVFLQYDGIKSTETFTHPPIKESRWWLEKKPTTAGFLRTSSG